MKVTIHDGELKRYAVQVRCTSHTDITAAETLVFSTSEEGAREAAIEKMQEKWQRNQNKTTHWVADGNVQEA